MSLLDLFRSKGARGSGGRKEKSLYLRVKAAAREDGTLPADFSLFEPGAQPNAAVSAAGAGEAFGRSEVDAQVLKPLTSVMELVSLGGFSEARDKLRAFFQTDGTPSMLELKEPLQRWVTARRHKLNPSNTLAFAVRTVTESDKIECVRFGLALFELLNVEENPKLREVVLTLAPCPAFAPFCAEIIRPWRNGDQILAELARKANKGPQ